MNNHRANTHTTSNQTRRPDIIRMRSTKKFGTDIHRHTVEFSKNTHTPSHRDTRLGRSGATVPAYPIAAHRRKPAARSRRHEDTIECLELRTSAYQPRVPRLSVGVGVRVALTWTKVTRTENGASNPQVTGVAANPAGSPAARGPPAARSPPNYIDVTRPLATLSSAAP